MKVTLLLLLVSIAVAMAAVTPAFKSMHRAITRSDFVQVSTASSNDVHELIFAIKQQNLPDLDEMLTDRSSPNSPMYQQWLTYEEVNRLAVNPASTQAVQDWLSSNGVEVLHEELNTPYIKAKATVAQWESLLDTKFFSWEDKSHQTKNKMSLPQFIRAKEYSLPTHMTEHLSAVFNTVQVPPSYQPKFSVYEDSEDIENESPNLTNTISAAATTTTATLTNGRVTIGFLNSQYQFTTNIGNSSMQQAIITAGEEFFSPTDLTSFQKHYKLPVKAASAPYGYTTTDCTNESCENGNVGIQYISGLAQNTSTVYWHVPYSSTTDPLLTWITKVANMANPPLVHAIPWGNMEQANSPEMMDAFNTEALKLSLMGVTVTAASGDSGAVGYGDTCSGFSGSSISYWPYGSTWTGRGYFPTFPATSPYVTAVGGTMGPELGGPEIVSQSQMGGGITSGGGFSTYYAAPSWQTTAVNAYFASLSTAPQAGYNPKGRAYPDLSMISVGYQTMMQGTVKSLFGTACSTPVLAAMVSLINADRKARGLPSLGFMNPTLWKYGSPNSLGSNGASYYPYTDVTSGNNKCKATMDPSTAECCSSGFDAAAGWDPASGFGSVRYDYLKQMFEPVPTSAPTAAPTSAPPSAPPTLSPSASPSVAPTASPTIQPTPTSSPSAVPTASPTITPTAPPSAVPTPTFGPTATPTLSPTSIPTLTPTAGPTPTYAPTVRPTIAPTAVPTPSPAPTRIPTIAPSALPSITPTAAPSRVPTLTPTARPSTAPSCVPSQIPSALPSTCPTLSPSAPPSQIPTASPSAHPTASPSVPPSPSPTASPTTRPSTIPTTRPTPTSAPSTHTPSAKPTAAPTPTPAPTVSMAPTTANPSARPSAPPSAKPSTAAPTATPTMSDQQIYNRTSNIVGNSIAFMIVGLICLAVAGAIVWHGPGTISITPTGTSAVNPLHTTEDAADAADASVELTETDNAV